MKKSATFTTTITKADGIRLPADAITTLMTSNLPSVLVHIKGHEYRSTVAVYGDIFTITLNQENRIAAKVQTGDLVEITLELDIEA